MDLISKINGELVFRLSGGKSTSGAQVALGNSSLGSRTKPNFSSGLEDFSTAFEDSASRLKEGITAVSVSKNILSKMSKVVDDLITLAKRSSSEETQPHMRLGLEGQFNALITEFKQLQNDATNAEIDLLDKDDIKTLLKSAGVNLLESSNISQAFQALSPGDTKIGYRTVSGTSVTVGSGVNYESANGVSDPLSTSVATRASAIVALEELLQLKDDVNSDLSNITTIYDELRAAHKFALEGLFASDDLLKEISNYNDAESVANALVEKIKQKTADQNIRRHSGVDSILVEELLAS